MRMHRPLLRLLTFIALLSLPLLTEAAGGQDISDIFADPTTGIIARFAPVWGFIAFITIVVAGLTLMLSENEGAIDKAKKTLIAVIIGGIIVVVILFFAGDARTLVLQFYNPVYNPGTTTITGTFNPNTLGLESEGVAQWLMGMAAMVGIVIIIIATLRAVTSFGGDEASYTAVRSSIVQVVIGLIVISAAYIFKAVFFTTKDPILIIAFVTQKMLIVLAIITTIAVGVLVYAGLRMVLSFGREDEYTAARSLAIRVVVGLLVIILSYALVFIVRTIF